jgi:SAM-dependent methyltransferase
MRRQDWSQVVSAAALLAAVTSLLRGRPRMAFALIVAAVAGDAAARRLSRGEPTPLPYALRWELALPRPTGPLRRALAASTGERILEIGPGLGQHAVKVAGYVGPEGRVDVLDVQQEMLDATAARAERRGVRNVVAALAAPSAPLPYADALFDAAYLVTVLGEIPDRQQILVELRRVLKSSGRLVVGEIVLDPDFVPARKLYPMAEAAGFSLVHRFGPSFNYHAQFAVA